MKLKISRILHAGYVFEHDQTQIAFDPIFENPFSHNCYAFPSVQFDREKIKKLKFDAVFISHFHDDHCSMESLVCLHRETPIYMYCVHDEMFDLIKLLGFVHVYSLKLDQSIMVGSFEIIPRRALDVDVDSIFQIKAGGRNVLNVVDSWIDDATLDLLVEQGPWDMVLWPFQTMREIEVIAPINALPAPQALPEEWMSQLKKLNPRYVVPSSCQFRAESWSWYNQAFFPISYKHFNQQVTAALPATKMVRLNPSVGVELDSLSLVESTALCWMEPVGDQDVDYVYQPYIQPPSTAEIAQHFAALSDEETHTVYDYCRFGLLEKFRSMDPPAEEYFRVPWGWKLSIYDHNGLVENFYYQLNENQIEQVAEEPSLLKWTTEIPLSKLYAGLVFGESLTSMYIRINAGPEVDIVDDPLIRCLFNGVFGSYQKAQLKRLNLI
ncbi:MAG: MBL fold metallo-hydrolase [Bdellovibrionaceae bacterium]|nr:MBL fold metallo-hydrolase [Pseudobdellovibrionaceae bacterium]